MYFHTLREVPGDGEIPSHRLLLRAGMIRKLASGIYGYMPLGYRVIRKIEQIIREEMDAKGAQELTMPAFQPGELWKQSDRWADFGQEIFRLMDRNGREFCLGPTHEEIFAMLVGGEVKSYRELPLNLYQIQKKYRDEKRPRLGLIDCREFIMKDAYSFDKDWDGLDLTYWEMHDTYSRIFRRCGLDFRVVKADMGMIGGLDSHEFTVLSQHGEDMIACCNSCDFAATLERAVCAAGIWNQDGEERRLLEIYTPNIKTIHALKTFLGVPGDKLLKTLIFKVKDQLVAAVLRGDRELNKVKLANALKVPPHALEFASAEDVKKCTGAETGFAGPVGLRHAKIVADQEVPLMKNAVAGANKTDYHMVHVNYGRDFQADMIVDLRLMEEGDPCPQCGSPVTLARGIAVGQIRQLGTKYSEVFEATYVDENMEEKLMVMGAYGIEVSRTMAAIVEQHHDEDGILWPLSVAPYQVMVTVVNVKDATQMCMGEKIYQALRDSHIDVLLDDRDERGGVKFKDADLIGIPIRITVGKRAGEGIVEFKLRREKGREELAYNGAVFKTLKLLKQAGMK
ncbi:Proline--tRNA ligase [Thermotalea metallivorans]|uniref:Proline--tRNA ligase n=2 Tax=Thermotalea metallivorans TaxID=520762 RepID=A0A140L2N6_9FIRM|nr:Proline--tRNA ligase [Thermotalea metallivorans]